MAYGNRRLTFFILLFAVTPGCGDARPPKPTDEQWSRTLKADDDQAIRHKIKMKEIEQGYPEYQEWENAFSILINAVDGGDLSKIDVAIDRVRSLGAAQAAVKKLDEHMLAAFAKSAELHKRIENRYDRSLHASSFPNEPDDPPFARAVAEAAQREGASIGKRREEIKASSAESAGAFRLGKAAEIVE